jgi:hypothetical protein
MNLEYLPEMANIIQSNIIDCQAESIYKYLISNNDSYITVNKSKLLSPFSEILKVKSPLKTFGIDLPIFIKSPEVNASTIMICAMDPLPPLPDSLFWKNKNVDIENDVGFGTPFNIGGDLKNPIGSMKTNIPFFKILNEKFNLYVTDIFKLFFRVEFQGGLLASNSFNNYTELKKNNKNVHASIIAEEINVVKPESIITLGAASISKLLELNRSINGQIQNQKRFTNVLNFYKWNNTIPIISSPHISGSANGSKSKIINNELYKNIISKYQNEKLALIITNYIR